MLRSEVEEGRSGEGSIVSGYRGTKLRLPPIWSRQARSAILHALSLANIRSALPFNELHSCAG